MRSILTDATPGEEIVGIGDLEWHGGQFQPSRAVPTTGGGDDALAGAATGRADDSATELGGWASAAAVVGECVVVAAG